MFKNLCYLSEELVVAFFDGAVSLETKQHMVAKLQNEDDEHDSLKKSLKYFFFVKDKHLQDFVITKTNNCFAILRLNLQ